MADIVTNTLQIGSNNLVLRDADAQAKVAVNTQDITSLKEESSQILNSAYVTDTASGSIASFPDGADGVPVKSLKVNVEPVQDLHGYDSPWAGGGGKNLCNYINSRTSNGITFTYDAESGATAVVGTATANAWSDAGISATAVERYVYLPAGTYTVSLTGNGNDITGRVQAWYDDETNEILIETIQTNNTFTLIKSAWIYTRLVVASGKTVDASVYVQIEKGSQATPFEPYENVCPISGHTQAVVTRTGKNLFRTPNSGTSGGITYTVNDDGSITFNGTATAYTFVQARGVLKAGTYTINAIGSQSDQYRCQIRTTSSTSVLLAQSHTGTVTRFTLDKDTDVFFRVVGSNTSGNVANNVTIYPMLELGSSVSEFAPYNGQTVTIDLGGTIYGGTLDLETGELKMTHKCVTMDGATRGHAVDTVGGRGDNTKPYNFYLPHSDGYLFGMDSVGGGWVDTSAMISHGMIYSHGGVENSDHHTWHLAAYVGGGGTVLQPRIFIPLDAGIDTVAKCNDWLAQQYANGTPVQYIYPLATPITVQLTANEISTVLGQNNIWNDCGDTEVEYRSDTKLYIKKLTGSTEEDMVADANIVSGQYFMVGNTLYKATANIASGGAITPNVNCTRKSLPEALNEINV